MAAILPFLLLIIVWLLLISLFPRWGLRRAFLRALAFWGAWAYLSIEILSLFRAVTFTGIFLVWLIPLVGCGIWLAMRWRSGQVIRMDFSWLAGWEMKLLLVVLLVVLVVTGLVAGLAPPNTFDSLRYHMPRVAEWAQNHTVAHYPTDIEIQNSYPPEAEYGILHLYVLAGGDSLANFIQWLAMFGCIVGVTLLAGLFKSLANFSIRDISLEVRAIIALAFGYGAFEAEVFRAGIQSISKGQMEAARSLGMTYVQAMRYIILPQAIRRVLPPLGNDFIALLKDSSLATTIAVPELTQMGRLRRSSTYRVMETFNVVAFLYLSMTLLLSGGVRFLERIFKYED